MDELEIYALSNRQICIIYHIADQGNNFIPPLQQDAFQHPQIQFLSFPCTIINYSLSAATSEIYQKFIQSCKYFYSKKRITIIPDIIRHRYYQDRETKCLQLDINQISKIWITMLLEYRVYYDPYGLSKFCSKIYKCHARCVDILYQKLTEEEFHFLVQPDLVIELRIAETPIIKANGNLVTVEEVFERVTKVQEFEFSDSSTTSKTFSNLAKFPAKNKLKRFAYDPFEEENMTNFHLKFNSEMFKIFVTKNAAPNAEFKIYFGYTTEEWLEKERKKINRFLKSWRPRKQKPTIIFQRNLTNILWY